MGQRTDEIGEFNRPERRDNELPGVSRSAVPAPNDGQEKDEPAAIRTEIEHTRAEMGETIDAIQEKLDPDRLKARATHAIRGATIGRVEETVGDAADMAQEAMYSASETAMEASSTMMDTIKRNPIPSLLAGVGLGWLFMNRTPRRAAYRTPYYGEAGQRYGSTGSATAYRQETGGLGEVADRVGQTASQAQERVGDVASNAGEMARDAGTSIGDMVRENPVPAAIIGLGLGWMAINGGAQRRSYRPYDAAYGEYPYGDTDRSIQDKIGERAGEFAGQAQETAGEALNRAKDTAEQVAGQVQGTVGDFTRQTQYQAERVEDRLRDLVYNNPLAAAAGAVAVGAALGLTLPSTQREQELLGDTANNFMEQARSTAENVKEKVERVADEVKDSTQEAARKEGLTE